MNKKIQELPKAIKKQRDGTYSIKFNTRIIKGENPKTLRGKAFSETEAFAVYEDLKLQAKEMKEDKHKYQLYLDGKQPFSEFINNWYQTVHRPTLEKRSNTGYLGTIKWLEGHFGSAPLNQITPGKLIKELNTLNDTPSSKRKKIDALSLAFSYANKHGMIQTDPMLDIKRPRVHRKSPLNSKNVALNDQQRDSLEQWLKNDTSTELLTTTWKLAISVALLTGMRPSEIIALTWDDMLVNSKNESYFHVNKSMDEDKTFKETKTGEIRDTAVFPNWLQNKLTSLHKKQNEFETKLNFKIKPNYIFFNSKAFIDSHGVNVYPLSLDSLNKHLRDIQKKLNIILNPTKDIHLTMYNLRHTWATWAFKNFGGAEKIPLLASVLGHSPSVFIDTYVNTTYDEIDGFNDQLSDIYDD